MTHFINYILHRTVDPFFSYVEVKNNFPEQSLDKSKISTIQRLAHFSIPFLARYKPFGKGLSMAMGGCRTLTHLSQAIKAGRERKFSKCGVKLFLTTFSVVAIASTYFHSRFGLLVTTGIDIIQNLESFTRHYKVGETNLLLEDAVQLTSSSLYLAMMVTGSLEISLASIVLQAAFNIYQTRQEWNKGNTPEALAKLLMCCLRVYDGKQQWMLIQRRNQLLSDPLLKQVISLIKQGKKVESLLSSPLSALKDKILQKAVVLEDAQGKKYKFGSHFHGFGKGLVKGANLCFRLRTINGKEIIELDFKINHAFRNQLDGAFAKLSSMPSNKLNEVLALSHSNVKGIEITKGKAEIGGFDNDVHLLKFEGIGSVLVGSRPDVVGLYSRVVVRVFQDCNLFQLHEMLAFLGLEDVLQIFNTEDLERLKLGLLFRTFFPKEATLLERTMKFFTLPISKLKDEMNKQVPTFQEVFNRFYPRIKPYETLPGRVRYGIDSLGNICEKLGAKALMSSVYIDSSSDNQGLNRIVSLLKMGLLSTELRFGSLLNVNGLSSNEDLETGGSDSVFAQLVPSNYSPENTPIAKKFGYFRGVALTYSLDALNTGTYQYHIDSYGTRRMNPAFQSNYLNRPNIFDFVMHQRRHFNQSNEVMLKERVPPHLITGILVSDKNLLDRLTDHLRTAGLIQLDKEGKEMIFNIPVSKFIRTPSTEEPVDQFFMHQFIKKAMDKLNNKVQHPLSI